MSSPGWTARTANSKTPKRQKGWLPRAQSRMVAGRRRSLGRRLRGGRAARLEAAFRSFDPTPIPCHLRDSRLRKLCRLGRGPASRARLGCEIGGHAASPSHGTLSRSLGHYMPTLTITVDALMCATRGPARMRMRHARRVTGDGSGGNHKGRKQHRRRSSDDRLRALSAAPKV